MKFNRLSLLLLAAGCVHISAQAQSNDQRIQALEKQVQQLMQELQSLKTSAQKTAADAPTELVHQVENIKQQVELNQKEAVVLGDIPGSFRLPGSDTSVKIYGFAELQAWRDSKGTTAYDFSTATAYQPLNGSADANRTGNFKMGARTSRLGVEVSTPTSLGALGAKVEFDFATEAGTTLDSSSDQASRQAYTNSYRPRLRHGYLTLGSSWTLGQTWSTFMDLDTLPETLDFNGLPSAPFVRQAMIRYAHPMKDIGTLTVAVENPVSYVTKDQIPLASNFSRRPDLIVRFDKIHDWGQWNVRLLSTQYHVNDGAGLNKSRTGVGYALGGMLKTTGDDFLTLQYTNGTGLGRYNISFTEVAVLDGAQNIQLEEGQGVVTGYQFKFSPQWRSNVGYAWQKNKNNALASIVGSSFNSKLQQFHINAIYTPYKNFDLGIEYLWGQRETVSGDKGALSRLMGSAKYSF
jgi:hypothetical protein